MKTLDLFDLSGKTALVTGCDTGLGMGMATALAEAGADVVGASIVEDYAAVKNAVEATGRKFTYHRVDISDRKALYDFINKVKAENKKIDILVNNAGIIMRKSAVAGLVRAFGNEWGSKGVCVNGIAPGYIATNNTHALREDPERSQSILGRIPAARWGVPDDFKGPVVFLASSASDYVNGTVLFVDGGWMAR